MTPLEQAVLNRIQADFPLAPEPYSRLAEALDASPTDVRQAVAALRASGIIRRIGGSFAAARLGYVSALVATRVEPVHLETAARAAAQFDEVTHDYERNGEFNLWFTVVAETQERLRTVTDHVAAGPGVRELHVLPALRTFKIRVNFDVGEAGDEPTAAPAAPARPASVSSTDVDAIDRRLIARCCDDLGDGATPFADLAAELGLTEVDVLARLQRYRAAGLIRRFGAMIRHQQAGFTANAMGVWDVPEEEVERVGTVLAGSDAVSHCYERPRFAGWPYNLYSMIHGRSPDACRGIAEDLTRDTGITARRLLFTGREFKKSSVRYFAQDWPRT